jgi:hypothetical protein
VGAGLEHPRCGRDPAHYDNDVEFTSPYVAALGFDPSGTLHGVPTLRRYFAAGLDRFPDLRFDLHGVLTGVDSLTIVYTSVQDQKPPKS